MCGQMNGQQVRIKGIAKGLVTADLLEVAHTASIPVLNAWAIIHTRLARYATSGETWNPVEQKRWHDTEFMPLVPSDCSCSDHWGPIAKKIDWSTAQSAETSLYEAHNEVSAKYAGNPTIGIAQARELWRGPKVAVIAVNYAAHGGTETFHQTLLPRLRHFRNIIGFGAIHGGGNPALLKVPYYEGREAISKLCSEADVVVTWGIDELTSLLPGKRPKVIAVHHGDKDAGWIGETIWQQGVDEFVCVNREAAYYVKTKRDLPVHWIPNALDESRIKATSQPDTEGKRICLFGHRMSEEKRPQLAVEIAKRLPSGWLVVMAGDGPLKPIDPPSNLRLVGRVDSLANWLSVSTCFLSLSTFEGFGLSMAEAHAMCVPIVATPRGIASEVAATLLPVDSSPEQWAAAIVESVGKQNKPADFSVEKHVAAWAGILK